MVFVDTATTQLHSVKGAEAMTQKDQPGVDARQCTIMSHVNQILTKSIHNEMTRSTRRAAAAAAIQYEEEDGGSGMTFISSQFRFINFSRHADERQRRRA